MIYISSESQYHESNCFQSIIQELMGCDFEYSLVVLEVKRFK